MKAARAVLLTFLAVVVLLPLALTAGGALPAAAGAAAAGPALEPGDFDYTAIDYPGATRTWVFGVNSESDVVGRYLDGTAWRGFMLRDGVFTTFTYPGAPKTTGLGVNSRGDIAGTFLDSGGKGHGFLLADGRFTEIAIDGGVDVYAYDINDSGVVLGRYEDVDTHEWVNFLWRDGKHVTLPLPTVAWAEAVGLNDRGEVVGHFVKAGDDTNHMIGFLYWKGSFTAVDYPQANAMACFQGISDTGDVVGHVQLGQIVYGTIWAKGTFAGTLRVPGAKGTYPHGMTPSGVVAGYSVDVSGYQHGFVASRKR
jgi:uncharacterized membrane protein